MKKNNFIVSVPEGLQLDCLSKYEVVGDGCGSTEYEVPSLKAAEALVKKLKEQFSRSIAILDPDEM